MKGEYRSNSALRENSHPLDPWPQNTRAIGVLQLGGDTSGEDLDVCWGDHPPVAGASEGHDTSGLRSTDKEIIKRRTTELAAGKKQNPQTFRSSLLLSYPSTVVSLHHKKGERWM